MKKEGLNGGTSLSTLTEGCPMTCVQMIFLQRLHILILIVDTVILARGIGSLVSKTFCVDVVDHMVW